MIRRLLPLGLLWLGACNWLLPFQASDGSVFHREEAALAERTQRVEHEVGDLPLEAKVDARVPGACLWGRRAGGAGSESLRGAAVDSQGRVYLVGDFTGKTDLGDGAVNSKSGTADIFVLALDATGAHRWSKVLASGGTDQGSAVAVHPTSGDLYVLGSFQAQLSGGGVLATSPTGMADILLVKYGADGTFQWHKGIGGLKTETPLAVVATADGGVIIAGSSEGALDAGSGPLSHAGSNDALLASYDASGKLRWAKLFGGTGLDEARGLALDASGNVYVTGKFSGSATLNGKSQTAVGGSDAFLATFTADGSTAWWKGFGATGDDSGHAIAVDGATVFLTGSYSGALKLGSIQLVNTYPQEIFIAGLGAGAGNFVWARRLSSSATASSEGLAVDPTGGGVLVAGSFDSDLDLGGLGGSKLQGLGFSDSFVIDVGDVGGDLRWVRRYGGAAADHVSALAVGGGRALLGGTFSQSGSFCDPLTSAGLSDVFAVALQP